MRFRFEDLSSMLSATIEEHGERPAFGVLGADGRWTWTTWKAFGARVDALRGGLATKGVKPGDRIAVISNNRIEWLVGAFAAYGLRATWVPMYEAMTDSDCQHILRDAGAKICFVANEKVDARVAALAPDVERVRFGAPFEALEALGRDTPAAATTPNGDDIAMFIYTSGTTGRPKGVRLTHRSLASNAQSVQAAFPLSSSDRSLAFLPWAHVGGAGTEVSCIVLNGGSTGICERPDLLLTSLPAVQPTVLLAVPRVWNKIYDGVHKQMAAKPAPVRALFRAGIAAAEKLGRGERLSLRERFVLRVARRLIFAKIVAKLGGRLRLACSGAAALSPEVARFVQALGLDVYEAYGMTEVSSLATINPLGAARIGTVGKPLPGVEIRIDRAAVPDAARGGEIVIHGHGVMAGYHGLPDETAKALTADGGLRSGDVGYLDADGYLTITGRVKEIYKLENGKYVSPVPHEEKITLSPLIAQAMVHGQDKPFNVAVLVPDASALRAWAEAEGIPTADLDALCKHPRVRARYAEELQKSVAEKSYERIERFILVPEEFTVENEMLTPSMKLKRHAVAAKHGAAIEALYTAT